jgi:hypothetical protein
MSRAKAATIRHRIVHTWVPVCVCIALLSACTSSDDRQAKILAAEIENSLLPGDTTARIEEVALQKGWRLRRVGPGYIGYASDPRVSSKALQIVIQLDDQKRFVDSRVEPYRNRDEPFPPIDHRSGN